VIGDVQFLFDFAICGFAKAGTSSLLMSLERHPETRMESKEWFSFFRNQARGVESMYQMVKKQGGGVMGYKNPHDIQYPSVLKFYRTHAPQAKLLVTIRHPVTWFNSFYNYRVVNNELWSIRGHPNNLTINDSSLKGKASYVNAASGAFHRYLAHLGKTPLDKNERELLNGFLGDDELIGQPPLVPNPVFLMEMRQLGDSNSTRSFQLVKDLQTTLGLQQPIESITHTNSFQQAAKKPRAQQKNVMDICKDEFLPIREEMMHVARNASLWIREYFIKSSNVTVSSPEYFEELMESWMHDPCQTTIKTS
jgi:hypothetical protein